MGKYLFPEGFLWGSSTSAFQVEGECINHDFYDWAIRGRVKDNSNPYDAVHHFRKYKEDIKLLKAMNHKAARIGLEWARIETAEGVYDDSVLEHYRDELMSMKLEGISTMVTLHHFSNPLWFSKKGGFENPDSIEQFLRYVKHTVKYLGDLIDFYITINEPTILAYKGYFTGEFPPGKRSIVLMRRVNRILACAHISAYDLIHKIHSDNNWDDARVSVAKHMRTFDPFDERSPLDRLSAAYISKLMNYEFLNYILASVGASGCKGTLDFFGINYYSGDLVKFPFNTLTRDQLKKNKLGWDIYPEGFYRILMEVWNKYHLPIYITENGTCDEHDELRADYIREHIKAMHRAIKNGVLVKGYYHWSTMDNFELVEGLSIRFGLVHIDHDSFDKTRTIKESGKYYAAIIENNGLIEEN